MYGVSNFFWSYSSPGLPPMQTPPCLATMRPVALRCAATCRSLPS